MSESETSDDDEHDEMEVASDLISLFNENIRADWEYFAIIQQFVIDMDTAKRCDGADRSVGQTCDLIGNLLQNGSYDIKDYISNIHFVQFYENCQISIDKITRNFNVKFKIGKNKVTLHPWKNHGNKNNSNQDSKRKLVSESDDTPPPKAQALEDRPMDSPPLPVDQPGTSAPAANPNEKLNTEIKVKHYNIYYEITANYKQMLQTFKDKHPEANAKITGEHIRITTTSAETYRAIQKQLEVDSIPFRTLDPRSERPRKVLIRGLPVNTPIEDIELALQNAGLEPISIAHLRSRKAENKGTPLPLYVVTLRATPNFEEVFELSTINYLKIKVDKFKAQPYRQCYRCQQYGHASYSCQLTIKCLKCAQNHNSKDCKVTEKADLKCAGCGGNHPANHRGCPKHPENRNKPAKPQVITTPATTARQGPPNQPSTFTTPTQNPWEVLATLPEEAPTDSAQPPVPGTSGTTNKNKNKNTNRAPSTNENKNRTPPAGTKTNKTSETSFSDLFETLKQIRELMQNYSISDIIKLLKSILQIFTSPELAFIDKLAAIFLEINNYCNANTQHE